MGNDIETKDKIEPQRTHPTRKAKLMTIIILIFFAGKWDLVCRTQLRMPKVGTM